MKLGGLFVSVGRSNRLHYESLFKYIASYLDPGGVMMSTAKSQRSDAQKVTQNPQATYKCYSPHCSKLNLETLHLKRVRQMSKCKSRSSTSVFHFDPTRVWNPSRTANAANLLHAAHVDRYHQPQYEAYVRPLSTAYP